MKKQLSRDNHQRQHFLDDLKISNSTLQDFAYSQLSCETVNTFLLLDRNDENNLLMIKYF